METRILEKSDWEKYFVDLSHHLHGKQVMVEVLGLDLGDQIGLEWTTLTGLSYDVNNDCCYVFTENLRHSISHPQRVSVLEDEDSEYVFEIEDSDQRKQIVILRRSLLPISIPTDL